MRCLVTNRRPLTILDHRKIVFCVNWMRVVDNWLCNLNTLLFQNNNTKIEQSLLCAIAFRQIGHIDDAHSPHTMQRKSEWISEMIIAVRDH